MFYKFSVSLKIIVIIKKQLNIGKNKAIIIGWGICEDSEE
jgi:hypothetical protein